MQKMCDTVAAGFPCHELIMYSLLLLAIRGFYWGTHNDECG